MNKTKKNFSPSIYQGFSTLTVLKVQNVAGAKFREIFLIREITLMFFLLDADVFYYNQCYILGV